MRMMPRPAVVIPRVVPAAPAPTPAVVGIPPPAEGVEPPIPPQAVAERGEGIGVEAVIVDVPVPRVQPVDHVEVEGAADGDGVARIAETDDARGILVVVRRAVESADPLAVQPVVRLPVNVEGIVLRGKVIVRRVVATIVGVHVHRAALRVAHDDGGGAGSGAHGLRRPGLHHHLVRIGDHDGLACIILLLNLVFLGRHVIKVVHHALRHQSPGEAQGHKR